jgi:signal transduction histidine kinase
MRLRALPVIATLLVASTLLVVVGAKLLQRDRAALFERFGQDRKQTLEEAARGLLGEVTDIGDDLELASTLLEKAETIELAERELHAIATIKREYLVMHARSPGGPTTRVTAFDAPAGAAELADPMLDRMLDVADASPGRLHVSERFAERDPQRWYRVFSWRSKAHGSVVAVAVDMTVLFGRMKLPHDQSARTVMLDANGHAAPTTDGELARLAETGDTNALIDLARTGESNMSVVPADLAHRAGLPDTAAVAIAVPIAVEPAGRWVLLALASTMAIENQERIVVRRVLVGSVLVLVLLLSAAAYVIRNSYRAREMQRLLHSEKLVTAGQLAAGIAHEIGTPLNVARARVELTMSHLGKDHAEAANQQVVIDQIDRVTRQLQQLLDYVRPAPASIQQIDVASTLQTVADLLAPQAAKRGVSLRTDAALELPRLAADPDHLQQILVNLALNAIDASERGQSVALRARARDGRLAIEISDAGHGIPRDLQKQVFDPFFTTKKRGQGTGLGLWVVAQLVRAQSAEIELESAAGQGTTVRLMYPVKS